MQHLLRVIPVIGILSNKKDFHPSPNADEVEDVFDAPLEMFLKVFSQLVVFLVHIKYSAIAAATHLIDNCDPRMRIEDVKSEFGWETSI